MPVALEVEYPGENHLDIAPFFLSSGVGKVVVCGKNNVVHIGNPRRASDACVHVSGGATVLIGDDCLLGSTFIYALAEGVIITIGTGSSFNGTALITAHETSTISIGAGCLIASAVTIMSSDVHHILDATSMERLNPPIDIAIGDHVWLSAHSTILRGATIGSHCVVGWGSVVRGVFPDNSLVVGSPARLVRENITWRG